MTFVREDPATGSTPAPASIPAAQNLPRARIPIGEAGPRQAPGPVPDLAAFVPGFVFQLRLRRNGSICLPYASEALCKIFRLDADEVRKDGAKFLAMIHPSDVPDYLNSIRMSAADMIPWRHEFRVKQEDGRSRWLLSYAVPQRERGGAVLWHGFMDYVTGHARARISQMKGDFLSTAVHELRAPVTTIYGFAEVLSRQSTDEASQREFLAVISRKMVLLSAIIGNLADLAGLESRQGEDFVFAPTDLANLVREAVAVFSLPEGCSAPALRLPEKPMLVLADRNRAMQAITKVLAHVYQCSPPGKTARIGVNVSRAAGATGANGAGARRIGISVVHQSLRMNEHELKPTRARSMRAGMQEDVVNMGLAMSIVREIVEFHGGEVRVKRKAGRCTGITLLFCEAETSTRVRGAKTAPPARGLRKGSTG